MYTVLTTEHLDAIPDINTVDANGPIAYCIIGDLPTTIEDIPKNGLIDPELKNLVNTGMLEIFECHFTPVAVVYCLKVTPKAIDAANKIRHKYIILFLLLVLLLSAIAAVLP